MEQVDGIVKTAEAVVIQPGETKKISGLASFKGNSKRINVFTEPLEEALLEEEPAWTAVPSYSECKNSSSRIGVAIRNVSRKVIVIAKGQQVAQVSAANQVPNMLAPKYNDRISKYDTEKGGNRLSFERRRNNPERITKLWKQLDVTGADSWTENQKLEIRQVFEEYSDVFALNSLELGRTSLVKHHKSS